MAKYDIYSMTYNSYNIAKNSDQLLMQLHLAVAVHGVRVLAIPWAATMHHSSQCHVHLQ